jgi:hypothetical protein
MAAWNGHVRCVQLLAVNPWGRNNRGERASCIDMQSGKGLTPLMLAVQGGENLSDVVAALLCCGADADLTDYEGKTAIEMARELKRSEREIVTLRGEAMDEETMQKYRGSVAQQFRIQRAQERAKNGDGVRIPARPVELMMHEHEILPFAKANFSSRTGRQGIRNLLVAEEQALKNIQRRTALVAPQDSSQVFRKTASDAYKQ